MCPGASAWGKKRQRILEALSNKSIALYVAFASIGMKQYVPYGS
jgi:hypothetical protein